MKRLSTIFALFVVVACIVLASPSFVLAKTCVIKWWGDSTGYVTTNETGRTEQARHEAIQAVFGYSGCSAPCFVYGCFPLPATVPEGCDGFGDWADIPPFDGWCYTAILCDTGEWEYSSINYDGDGLMLHTSGFWDVLCGIDTDSDGWPDLADNCIDDYNPFQIDCDDDGTGDICDTDTVDPDGDGVDVACDNCPNTPNSGQEDTDSSGIGNACNDSMDADSDEWEDNLDNCPNDPNPLQEDSYPPFGNGIGDACDCEGNFNCDVDSDVDGSDAALFKADFGRSVIVEPCTGGSPCNGDFNCDNDCDGTDAFLFKQDFGRSSCPVCESGLEWWCIQGVPLEKAI